MISQGVGKFWLSAAAVVLGLIVAFSASVLGGISGHLDPDVMALCGGGCVRCATGSYCRSSATACVQYDKDNCAGHHEKVNQGYTQWVCPSPGGSDNCDARNNRVCAKSYNCIKTTTACGRATAYQEMTADTYCVAW